ncbi:hypothetical protein [Ekhidna sp.]|uniref:hypothetical protein n=1 Tax=Ekhidna sp. TaxID=2608089 RepID=UPI003B50FE95
MRFQQSLVFLFLCSMGYAQTCCTATSTSQELINPQQLEKGTLRAQLLTDYNVIDNISLNSNTSRSQTIERAIFSITSQMEYSLSQRWSLGFSLPYQINTEETSLVRLQARGIGDLVSFVKMSDSLSQSWRYSLGIGVKVPTGETTNTSEGIIMPPTLQNGTGSTDMIFFVAVSGSPFDNPNSIVNVLLRYRKNGNSDGLAAHRVFKFGNEYELFLAYQNQLFIFSRFIGYSVGVRTIVAEKNNINHLEDANSGGYWLALAPQITYPISPKVGATLGTQVPLFFDLNGLQLVTRMRLNLGITALF